MRIPPTPSPSEAPHALHLTPQSKAGSAASLKVGGPPAADASGAHDLRALGSQIDVRV